MVCWSFKRQWTAQYAPVHREIACRLAAKPATVRVFAMCGIVGLWNRRARVGAQAFERMTESLAARGPDGQGIIRLDEGRLMFGHRRLAIIDLSSAGEQPMCNEDQSLWLVFNGEIYNYLALKKELSQRGHIFRSHSDTETILHAYEEWGKDCVLRLRGIFAFGIFDCRQRTLFLARDHVGVKPLYFYRSESRFAFASQPRAILAADDFVRDVHLPAFSLFLAYGNVPAEFCIFDGIEKLRPGHWLFLSEEKITIQQYWHLQYAPKILDAATAIELVREKIEESVLLNAVSDVPVGTLLSGGVDSTIITSILAQNTGSPLPTFTVGFTEEQSDEAPYARLVADHLHTQHHQRILTYDDACMMVPDIVEAMDEPFHLNGLFPFFAVSRLVNTAAVKVVLGGDGADELFAGYRWYDAFGGALAEPQCRPLFERLKSFLTGRRHCSDQAVATFFHYNGHFSDRDQRHLLGGRVASNDPVFAYLPLTRAWRPNIPPVLAAQLMDFSCFLVDHCLTKVDRMSMACGVEVRVPMLDVELVEAVFSIDHNLVFRDSERKALLIAAMSRHFPANMPKNRKKGFSSPLTVWLGRGLAHHGLTFLMSGSLVSRGLLNPDVLSRRFFSMSAGDQLLLISGELWSRRWIEQDRPSIARFVERLTVG